MQVMRVLRAVALLHAVRALEVGLSRRGALRAATAAAAAFGAAPAARADPSLLSSVQGPLQDALAPGHWIGQFAGLNSKTESWEFAGSSPPEVSAAILGVFEDLTPDRRRKLLIPNFRVSRADPDRIHVLTWTQAEWLDSFDVRLSKTDRGTRATASFYASGFFPTSMPLAPLLNIAMCWLPFASPGPRNEMLQPFRLRAIQGLVVAKLASGRTEAVF